MHTVFHAIVGYFFLLLTVRVLSRRPGAQMTLFEFVIVFLIGGIIILSTVGDDHSETNSVCAVLTVCLLHRLVSGLKQRFPTLQKLVDGTALVLIKDGQWQTRTMGRMRLQDTDVMAAARLKGVRNLSDIKYAVLERNGSISIIRDGK
ncbi:MAG TPA: YetF domain-containing protein [Bryobacteraceae bacterium]|jgi:uncharacterized membrane protein YcaP (DUF421 family)|nr:YetF domain-containing protein [Bryobacteraceae bacterium]